MPNGIDLILADHELVDGLFARFAKTGDGTVIGQIVGHLAAHDEAEHSALYPLVGELLGDAPAIERAAAAHSAIKQQIDRPQAPRGAAAHGRRRRTARARRRPTSRRRRSACSRVSPRRPRRQQLEWLGAHIEQTKQRVG